MIENLKKNIIEPTLKEIGLYSPEAEALVYGTACVESDCGKYRRQIKGPAVGIYQMEPDTIHDIYDNFLKYRSSLLVKIETLRNKSLSPEEDMVENDKYATAMCRIKYLRAKGAIPVDVLGQAKYWKANYNTALGKGTVEKYLEKWEKYND